METRSLAYIGLAFLTLTLGQAARAEEFSVPPHECVDQARNQLYSVDPPWFNEKHRIDDSYSTDLTAAALLQLSDFFDANGKGLSIVPLVPPSAFAPKGLNDSDAFGSDQLLADSTERAEALGRFGASVFDMSTPSQAVPDGVAYHRRTDHHWTAEGAARSAQFVSSKIFDTPFPNAEVWHKEFETFEKTPNSYLPPIMRSLVTDVCDPEEYRVQDSSVDFPPTTVAASLGEDSLFGSSNVGSVAILGSSHTAGDTGHVFPRGFEYYSGRSVEEYSYGGGAAVTPLVAFIEEDGLTREDIDHVVWIPSSIHNNNQITHQSTQ